MATDLELARQPEVTPMGLIQSAIQSAIASGSGLEVVNLLMKQQRDMLEYQAKIAFDQAMHRAQSRIKRVGFDKKNAQTNSRYTSYSKLDSVLRPIYTDEGFSLSFDTGESPVDSVLVLCYVSHEQGHTRNYRINMPADGKGAKGGDVMTRTHATGSAMQYGRRYLLKSIFNITEGEKDDDGNDAAHVGGEMPMKDFAGWEEKIDGAINAQQLFDVHAAAHKAALEIGDKNAVRQFMEFKNKRKGELR